MKLKPGTIDKYENSMAEAMEKAFLKIWPQIMYPHNSEDSDIKMPDITNHFRMIFIAVAQGIVRHLVDNAEAFEITVKVEGDNSVTRETHVEDIDLHKHQVSKPSYDADYYGCNPLDHINFFNCYMNHKHQIEETDTHKHLTFTTIESDDSLFNLEGV